MTAYYLRNTVNKRPHGDQKTMTVYFDRNDAVKAAEQRNADMQALAGCGIESHMVEPALLVLENLTWSP